MHFSQAKRAEVKEENPDVTFGKLSLSVDRLCLTKYLLNFRGSTGEIGKLLGAKWKEADAEERAVSVFEFSISCIVRPKLILRRRETAFRGEGQGGQGSLREGEVRVRRRRRCSRQEARFEEKGQEG